MSLQNALLLKHKIQRPWGVILFGLNCIVVSVPLLLNFNETKTIFLPNLNQLNVIEFLKYFACQFGHGGKGLPTWLHLFPNLINLIIMGTIVERAIGTSRFIIMCFTSWLCVTIFIISVNIVGFGSSGMLYSFWIFLVIILYKEWELKREEVIEDPLFLYIGFMVIWSWTITFLSNINPQGTDIISIFGFTNMVHLIGTITGVVYLIFWKKTFLSNLKSIQEQNYSELNYLERNHSKTHMISLIFLSLILLYNSVLFGMAMNRLL